MSGIQNVWHNEPCDAAADTTLDSIRLFTFSTGNIHSASMKSQLRIPVLQLEFMMQWEFLSVA